MLLLHFVLGSFGLVALSAAASYDIRGDIVMLGHIVRENVDKLERHEFRERQLGDNLMKSLSGMDRRLSSMDRLIREADKRAEKLDAALKEIRTEMQQQNQALLTEIRKSVENGASNASPTSLATMPCVKDDKIEQLEANITRRTSDALQMVLDAVKNSRSAVLDNLAHTADKKQLNDAIGVFQKTSGELLEKVTSTSNEAVKILRQSTDKNEEAVSSILNSFGGAANIDVRSGNNENKTQEILDKMDFVSTTLQDLLSTISQTQGEILKQVRSYGEVEQVLVRTADNVLDAKRTIEYSVHQIRAEVGEMVRQQSRELNTTLNTRFDDISTDIMTQQNGNAANLSSKIETEISQVWRQIGIMYQQLSNSAEMLQRLQQQTEAYVNGSLKTIGGMEGKVGQITGQMGQVDDNLQFLLGRLSLVTQEFNAVKSSVGATLDGLRSGMADVQNSIKDTGPGPNPLPPDYPSPSVETTN